MCTESATADDVRAAMPRSVADSAADPITLEPVHDVVITARVDNVYDALLTGDDLITWAPLTAVTAQKASVRVGAYQCRADGEHGFSALVTVRRGDTTTSVVIDTGLPPDAMVTNADRLGLDLSGVHAVVLSHGHFDHAGALPDSPGGAVRVHAGCCPPVGVGPAAALPGPAAGPMTGRHSASMR